MTPTPAETFAEALAVVGLVHTPATAQRALAIGPTATALLAAAARYPFAELIYIGDDAPAPLRKPTDRRLRVLPGPSDLPKDWKADVIAVTVPGLPNDALSIARKFSGPQTVVVFSVDQYNAGAAARRLVQKRWRVVIPFREYLPVPQMFLLASDTAITLKRPIPGWTKRLSESYLPALFRFPKDEYSALLSEGTTP